MKKLNHVFLAFGMIMVFNGCASAHFAPSEINKSHETRTEASAIQVFDTQLPTEKYFEIGAVSVCCGSDEKKLLEMLQEKAAENGGDGIIGVEPTPQGLTGTVIRFQK
jgi:hypothetical protein